MYFVVTPGSWFGVFLHTVSAFFCFPIHTAKYGFGAIYGQALFSVAIFGPELQHFPFFLFLGTFFFGQKWLPLYKIKKKKNVFCTCVR